MFNLVRQTLPFQESQLLKNVKKSLISQIPTMSLKRFLLLKKDATGTYKQTGDFAKKSVAVQKGSIQENIAKANLSDANVVSLAQPGEAINELKSGQVEGVVLEKAIAQGYVDQNSDLAVSDIALKSDSKDAYAVAMPKGSDKLKEKVNKVIAKLKKEGKIDSYVQDAYTLSLKSSTK